MPIRIIVPAPSLPTLNISLAEAIQEKDYILIIDSVHPVMNIDIISLCKSTPQHWRMQSTIQKQHDILIATLVRELLISANLKFTDLSAYAVVTGPGSWIGSRVGISAIKAFHLIHPHPIIELNSIPGEENQYFNNLKNLITMKFTNENFTPIEKLEPFYGKEYLVNGKEYKI